MKSNTYQMFVIHKAICFFIDSDNYVRRRKELQTYQKQEQFIQGCTMFVRQ